MYAAKRTYLIYTSTHKRFQLQELNWPMNLRTNSLHGLVKRSPAQAHKSFCTVSLASVQDENGCDTLKDPEGVFLSVWFRLIYSWASHSLCVARTEKNVRESDIPRQTDRWRDRCSDRPLARPVDVR